MDTIITTTDHPYQTYHNFSMNITSVDILGEDESEDSSVAQSFYCKDGMRLYRFIMEVVVDLPIEVFGFVGNILAFIVLYRQHSKGATNLLLQALALMDSLCLLASIQMRAVRYIHSCSKLVSDGAFYHVHSYIFLVFYPVMYMIRLVITWFTVWLTVDRWIAVCRPLHVQRLVTRRNVWIQIIGTVLLAIVITIPRCFEYRVEVLPNTTRIKANDLVKDKAYTIIYSITIFFIIMYLIPMSVLVIFNVKLTRALKNADRERESLRIQPNSATTSTKSIPSANRSLTLIVVFVTATFLICNIPPLISLFLYALKATFPEAKFNSAIKKPREVFTNISSTMVIVNSAVNFIIYCACSQKFRATFTQMSSCGTAVTMCHRGGIQKRPQSNYVSIKSTRGTLMSSLSVKSSTQTSELNYNNSL